MRRILVVPAVDRFTVAGNAGYQELYALTQTVHEMGERAYWYIVMPSWVRDGLQGHDRMHYIYLDCTRDPTTNDIVGYPALELARYFSRRGGQFIVDAAVTGCSRFALYLRQLLSDRMRKNPVPVFIREHSKPITWDVPEEWAALTLNYAGCHLGVRSEAELESVSRFVRRYATPATQRAFIDRAVIWPQFYYPVDAERNDQITAYCGGDFDQPSVSRRVMEVYRRLFIVHNVPTVLVTTAPQYKVDRAIPRGDKSFLRQMEAKLPLAVCRDQAARCHLFVSAATDDSNSLAFQEEIERLMLGQVGVFPVTDWAVSRLGKDYPFLYNPGNLEEAFILAEWIIENYADACARVSLKVEQLRRESTPANSAEVVWRRITREIDSAYKVNALDTTSVANEEGHRPLFNTAYKVAQGLGQTFALDVFLDVLEEHVTWLKPWSRKGTLKELGTSAALPTLFDIREMLDNLGWVDTCEDMNIFLRKEREPLPGVLNE